VTCVHLRKLYEVCHDNDLRIQLTDSELVRIVCRQCGEQEVCPSTLTDEYDARGPGKTADEAPVKQ
jgi:hypothetical protein